MTMTTNRRTTFTEAYEPKQRIVGGIVLFLLMLLLYSILKLVLGISTVQEGDYPIGDPLPDETNIEENSTTARTTIPSDFTFLNLDGKPVVRIRPPEQDSDNEPLLSVGGPHWVVQAASFKEKSRAQQFIQQLKEKGFDAYTQKVGNWYAVRLTPQEERRMALQQRRQLSNMMNIRIRDIMVKKID